jgi:hypothetical protein
MKFLKHISRQISFFLPLSKQISAKPIKIIPPLPSIFNATKAGMSRKKIFTGIIRSIGYIKTGTSKIEVPAPN